MKLFQKRIGKLYKIIGNEKKMAHHLMTAAKFGNKEALEHFVDEFLEKDPEKVANLARMLIQAGDKDAKYLLICCLEAMERYDEELIGLLQKEAEQGDRLAQFDLGCCYLDGKGVTQDYAKAYLWTLLAAIQGHPTAQNNIGYMYEKGICVEQNHEQAILWTLRAAANGSALGRESILDYLSTTDPVQRQQMMQSLSYTTLCHMIRPNVYGD